MSRSREHHALGRATAPVEWPGRGNVGEDGVRDLRAGDGEKASTSINEAV